MTIENIVLKISFHSLFGSRSFFTTTATFFFVFALALQCTGQVPTPTPLVPDLESEQIHYGDLIDVDVLGNLEYDWRGSLNPEGFLEGMVLANDPIYGLCKTESAIAAEIAAQYSRILKDPKIVVKIIDRSGRAATLLLGAVRNQQRFRLKREAKLSELLALSGGITDTASGDITIVRPANLNCFSSVDVAQAGKSTVSRFKISQLLQGDSNANPVILSGDIITVTEASPIYIIGGVNAPRPISSREEISVSRAVAAAGGVAKEGVESDVSVYRRVGKDTRVLAIDLKKIRSKQQDDILLKPFDIVDVGQKGRSKPKFPPMINPDQINRDIYKVPVRIID